MARNLRVEAIDDINPESIMDVVKKGKHVVLRPVRKKEAETSEESEAMSK